MHEELADAYRLLGHDDEARVAVITGAGRAFGAGADERARKQLDVALV